MLRVCLAALLVACRAAPPEVPAETMARSASHRASSSACTAHQGDTEGARGACASDADCREAPHGFCRMTHIRKALHAPACSYDACLSDAECEPGTACLCRGDLPHVCVPAECRIDADCAPPRFCAYSPGRDVFTTSRTVVDAGFFCHTPRDLCADDAGCVGTRCGFVSDRRRWECRASVP